MKLKTITLCILLSTTAVTGAYAEQNATLENANQSESSASQQLNASKNLNASNQQESFKASADIIRNTYESQL
ncbi:DUF3541 domain-containing protein, partial [Vibrio sp. D173a]|nr:DUF3541 domain-containing protein [Vibrio sp. D173a]